VTGSCALFQVIVMKKEDCDWIMCSISGDSDEEGRL